MDQARTVFVLLPREMPLSGEPIGPDVAETYRGWTRELRHQVELSVALSDVVRLRLTKRLGLPRDPEWRRILDLTDNRSMVDRIRRVNLLRLLQRLDRDQIPGSVVECGVARGGTAALLSLHTSASPVLRDVWLYDSFEGLPEPTREDGAEAVTLSHDRVQGRLVPIGEYVGGLEDVRSYLFRQCRLPQDRIHLVPGWFQDTLASYGGGPIALAHLDGDWYESVRTCLEALWPSVSPGGYVVVDDYGHWEGARRATREFLARQPGILLHRKGASQAFFRRPPGR